MPLKVYDFECKCGYELLDEIVEESDVVSCKKCNKKMSRIFPCPRNGFAGVGTPFSPFWSDTMQTRINDREDLKKLKQYAKDKGLTCVGHVNQKADRAAIRHNYESD